MTNEFGVRAKKSENEENDTDEEKQTRGYKEAQKRREDLVEAMTLGNYDRRDHYDWLRRTPDQLGGHHILAEDDPKF